MRQDAGGKAAGPVQQPVVERAADQAGQPLVVLGSKQPHRDRKCRPRKHPDRHCAKIFVVQPPDQEGAPEQLLHQWDHKHGAGDPPRNEQEPKCGRLNQRRVENRSGSDFGRRRVQQRTEPALTAEQQLVHLWVERINGNPEDNRHQSNPHCPPRKSGL